jgi:glycosyltransferase involved in cell wall biosynthesis
MYLKDEKKIKVCIISTILNAHIIRWARILALKGHDIVVISSEPNAWNIKDIHVVECLAVSSKSSFHNLLNQFLRTIKMRKIIMDLNPDIVHIHSLDYIHPLMFGLVNCFANGFKDLVISTWGTDIVGNQENPGTLGGRLAKKFLFRQAKEITATSHFLADATAQFAPAGKKIHVIPFGIDCKMFSKKGERGSEKVVRIGFIKHLEAKYGADYLLKAMASIIKEFPDVHLTLVGHGSMERSLKDLSVNLGIEKHTQFNGYIKYEQIPEVLTGIDIFVMPSVEDSETFGVAAIEAQAMEVPVVASNVGGVPEALIDGKTGILVEPRNIEQMAAAIITLVNNPDLRASMGKAGRQFVLEHYDIEENVLLFERLYRNLSGAVR